MVSRPAQSFDEALERGRALMALDDDSILPTARTKLFVHGKPMPYAVVLLHGLTNNPAQYSALAPLLFEAGANVLVPRMPEHGDRNRMTTRLAALTAGALLGTTTEALDIARGLGERVAVLGISMGGVLAAHAAQYRSDVQIAVPVSPMFSLLQLPRGVSRALVAILRLLPNLFLWWDPRTGLAQRPLHAYPRFSTHALAESMRIGDDVYDAAHREAARGACIVTVVNRSDPAVNNDVTSDLVRAWSSRRREGIIYDVLRNLPKNHDIIDPDNPLAKTELVYPKLFEALGLPSPAHLSERDNPGA